MDISKTFATTQYPPSFGFSEVRRSETRRHRPGCRRDIDELRVSLDGRFRRIAGGQTVIEGLPRNTEVRRLHG